MSQLPQFILDCNASSLPLPGRRFQDQPGITTMWTPWPLSTARTLPLPVLTHSVVMVALAVAAIRLPLLLPSASCFSIHHATTKRTPLCQDHCGRFASDTVVTKVTHDRTTRLSHSPLDAADAARPLPFSQADLARMDEMKTRGKVIPVVLLDALLPGQRIYFSSADPKFEKLLQYVIRTERDTMTRHRPSFDRSSTNGSRFISNHHGQPSTTPSSAEIGILGFHPKTGEPLTLGTTAQIPTKQITYGISRNHEKVVATSFKGRDTFQIVGDPWLDPTQSFYLAHVEVLQYRTEQLATQQQELEADRLFCTIPSMIDEWMAMLFTRSITSPAALQQQFKELGPMPPTKRDRAIWVAALLNPIQEQQEQQGWRQRVCEEIRPAMLACRNDHDRLILAATALQSSIDMLQHRAQA